MWIGRRDPMTTTQRRGPFKLLALVAGVAIVGSLLLPGSLFPALLVLIFLVAIYTIILGGARRSDEGGEVGRFSSLRLAPAWSKVPEGALIGLALWELGLNPLAAGFAGFAFGLLTSLFDSKAKQGIGRKAKLTLAEAIKLCVGTFAIISAVTGLANDNACREGLTPTYFGILVVAIGFALLLAVVSWAARFATLREVHWGTWMLAMLGLLELVAWGIAPVGQDVLSDAPVWSLVAACVCLAAIAIIGAWNPELVATLVGLGVLFGAVWFAGASEFWGVESSELCRDREEQLGVLLATAVGVVLGGGVGKTARTASK